LLALALGGCGAPAPSASPAIASEVVALVDGRPITGAEVSTQARAAGTDARTALAALVDAELLAADAERRGLHDDPAVVDAQRRALARRWLTTTFERELTPADIPESELRDAFERQRARFDHPELLETIHILAPATRMDDATREPLLRERARQVSERAQGVRSATEFSALAAAMSDERVRLRAEPVTTARRGSTEPAFADAAFALVRDGASSPPVALAVAGGWSVIYRVRRLPEEHRGFAEVEPLLRDELWPDFRGRELLRRLDELVARHAVTVHAERLPADAR
jgi:hypothetical protein